MTDCDSPRLASLSEDGWGLQNAEERLERGAGIYWLPDRRAREHLEKHVPEGGFATLLFLIHDPGDAARPVIERMWAALGGREGEFYHGHLANAPRTHGAAEEGMPVWFRAEHVIDFVGPQGENRASDNAEAIRCSQHGPSSPCYVGEHLTPESEGRGFHTADPEAVRPDAWCSRCHEEFVRAGSWEAAEGEPRVRLVCGGCYDALEDRHRGEEAPERQS